VSVPAGAITTSGSRQGTYGLGMARGRDDAARPLCHEMLHDLAFAGVDPQSALGVLFDHQRAAGVLRRHRVARASVTDVALSIHQTVADVAGVVVGAAVQRTEGRCFYRADAKVCNACPVKSACTNSANGRTIRRPFDQAYIERVQRYHDTGACQRAIRKRQACVEPLFAEAKTLHGLRRFRLRGIEKVNIEGLMVAAGQNLKRLFKYSGMRPPHWRWPSLLPPFLRSGGRSYPPLVPALAAQQHPLPNTSLLQHPLLLVRPRCQAPGR
jgi:hypothetical protein